MCTWQLAVITLRPRQWGLNVLFVCCFVLVCCWWRCTTFYDITLRVLLCERICFQRSVSFSKQRNSRHSLMPWTLITLYGLICWPYKNKQTIEQELPVKTQWLCLKQLMCVCVSQLSTRFWRRFTPLSFSIMTKFCILHTDSLPLPPPPPFSSNCPLTTASQIQQIQEIISDTAAGPLAVFVMVALCTTLIVLERRRWNCVSRMHLLLVLVQLDLGVV